MTKRFFTILLGLMLGTATLPATATAVEVQMGIIPVISYAGIFVALEKGFFKEQGIDLKLLRFAAAAKMIGPLAAGDLQVGSGSVSAGLFNAIAKGQQFKIVADKGQIRKGYNYAPLIVRSDLVRSGAINRVADFKGRKVSFFGPAGFHLYYLGRLLEEAGLSLKAIQIVYLPPPKQFLALKTSAIDVAASAEPWGTRAEGEGVGKIFTPKLHVPELDIMQVAFVLYSGTFTQQQPSVAQGFMNAYLKGIRYVNRQTLRSDEVAAMVAKYARAPAIAIKRSVPYYSPDDGKPFIASIMRMQAWMAKQGWVKKTVSEEQLIDLSYVERAARTLR